MSFYVSEGPLGTIRHQGLDATDTSPSLIAMSLNKYILYYLDSNACVVLGNHYVYSFRAAVHIYYNIRAVVCI